jgi:hypothetical protein
MFSLVQIGIDSVGPIGFLVDGLNLIEIVNERNRMMYNAHANHESLGGLEVDPIDTHQNQRHGYL